MNKTEVTSVKLVLFKFAMSFETLTKVDQLREIIRFGQVLSQSGKLWSGVQMITQNDDEMNFYNWSFFFFWGGGHTKLYP